MEVDPGPTGLADLVPTVLELTDILVGRAIRREQRDGRAVTCRAGCGACCRQMVPLSPPEAFFLADLLETFAPERRSATLRRFEAIARTLEERGLAEGLLDPNYSDDAMLAIAREYFSLDMPCPFLAAGSCGIYEHRPAACREYNVLSPAEHCADPYSLQVEKVPMPLPLSAVLARLTAGLDGSRLRLVPLTLAPRWAAGQQGLRGRRWPGPELFQGLLREVGQAPTTAQPEVRGAPST